MSLWSQSLHSFYLCWIFRPSRACRQFIDSLVIPTSRLFACWSSKKNCIATPQTLLNFSPLIQKPADHYSHNLMKWPLLGCTLKSSPLFTAYCTARLLGTLPMSFSQTVQLLHLGQINQNLLLVPRSRLKTRAYGTVALACSSEVYWNWGVSFKDSLRHVCSYKHLGLLYSCYFWNSASGPCLCVG